MTCRSAPCGRWNESDSAPAATTSRATSCGRSMRARGWCRPSEIPRARPSGERSTTFNALSGVTPWIAGFTYFPFQEPVRFLVDPFARTDRDDFDDVPLPTINDPEGSRPEAPQSGKLVLQRLSRRGIGKNRLQGRPGFPLQVRMHAADQLSDLIGNPEPVKGSFHDDPLSKQFVERVQPRLFLLQRP